MMLVTRHSKVKAHVLAYVVCLTYSHCLCYNMLILTCCPFRTLYEYFEDAQSIRFIPQVREHASPSTTSSLLLLFISFYSFATIRISLCLVTYIFLCVSIFVSLLVFISQKGIVLSSRLGFIKRTGRALFLFLQLKTLAQA